MKKSNLEQLADGRVIIKSEGRYLNNKASISVKLDNIDETLVKEFKSIVSCAEYLSISHATVRRRLRDGKAFKGLENQFLDVREI